MSQETMADLVELVQTARVLQEGLVVEDVVVVRGPTAVSAQSDTRRAG